MPRRAKASQAAARKACRAGEADAARSAAAAVARASGTSGTNVARMKAWGALGGSIGGVVLVIGMSVVAHHDRPYTPTQSYPRVSTSNARSAPPDFTILPPERMCTKSGLT